MGIEIWSMSNDILFDNIIITDSLEEASKFAELTFNLKRKYINKESVSIYSRILYKYFQNQITKKLKSRFLFLNQSVYSPLDDD